MKWLSPSPFASLRRSSQLLGVAAMFIALCHSHGGSYGPQAFTFPNGTTSLGDGSTIASNDGVASVQNNSLRLTENGAGGTSSSYKLPNLDGSEAINSFCFGFDLRLSATGQPADGFTLNFGNFPSDNGGGESGFAMAGGLVIAWDTYNNSNDAPSIEIFANGISVGNFPRTLHLTVSSARRYPCTGMRTGSMFLRGTPICSNLPRPASLLHRGTASASRRGPAAPRKTLPWITLLVDGCTGYPDRNGRTCDQRIRGGKYDSYEDEDTDNPDWIEIYNGQRPRVNLEWMDADERGRQQDPVDFPVGHARSLPVHRGLRLRERTG